MASSDTKADTCTEDAKKGADPKRKAAESPEADKPFPRLRRRASLPDKHDATDLKKIILVVRTYEKGVYGP